MNTTTTQTKYYIWANDDCCNVTTSFEEAKQWLIRFIEEGADSPYIVDIDNNYVFNSQLCLTA